MTVTAITLLRRCPSWCVPRRFLAAELRTFAHDRDRRAPQPTSPHGLDQRRIGDPARPVTLDALTYALARQGRTLDLSHCSGQGVPDLSSGFKVYGREIAAKLFANSEPQLASLSPSDYWHYGPETVTIIEAGLGDALIAEISRLTWDGQPATSFGEFRQVALYGELLAWVYARLEIPLSVAARLYDNLTPHLPLRTTVQGAEMLDALRALCVGQGQCLAQ